VPGLLAGLAETHRRFATREWSDLVAPALELARVGVDCDEPRVFLHSILHGVLLREEGGRRLYGDPARVETGDLCSTLESIRDGGAASVATLLPEYADDLDAYEVRVLTPIETDVLGRLVLTPPAPSRGGRIVADILGQLAAAGRPVLDEQARVMRAAYGASAAGPLTGTTHISVIDAAGTTAALSSTLGSGSGVFRGGAQMNNMLGELDVIGHEPRSPGSRLPTMLSPTLALEQGGPRLVLGSAGSVRLAGAIAQVAWRVLASGMTVEDAIEAPRVHVDGSTLNLEGGWPEEETQELGETWDVVAWLGRNLYFGGVQAVERRADGTLAAGGDPRRGGAGRVVP
jgi:gamma-glutamyltranspeptidase/glutathione hydrolase